MADRIEFSEVLAKLNNSDVLVFTSLSRVARSMVHMIEIEAAVAGASIRILDMNVDTSMPQGRLTFNLFGSIAQFEREIVLERQKVGIAVVKEAGKYRGRASTAKAKASKVLSLYAEGLTKQGIADSCSVGIASVYRILKSAA